MNACVRDAAAQGAKEVALETTSFSKLAGFTGIRLGQAPRVPLLHARPRTVTG